MKSMRHAFEGCSDVADLLPKMVRSNRDGVPVGLFSICSANRLVLEAGMMQAAADDTVLCIESTSNQVNQFGGYMGMNPAAFAEYVGSVASAMGFPRERVVLGGVHLGPHVWQNEPADAAMLKNRTHWEKYYHGDERDLYCARKYSYSGRSRYYWAQPKVQKALMELFRNLAEHPVPLTLLSQFMPARYQAIRERRVTNTPVDLVHDKFLEVMDTYARACGMR